MGPDADDLTIATAYRVLARRHHPDLAGEAQTGRMSVINAAFDRIRDETRRIAYDRELDDEDRAAGRPATRSSRRRARTFVSGRHRSATGSPPPLSRAWTPERDGTGGAGEPPGRPSGSVLPFGRHIGWSIGEVARVDPGYLVWLEGRREGRPYRAEIDATLRRIGYRVERPGREQSRFGHRGSAQAR